MIASLSTVTDWSSPTSSLSGCCALLALFRAHPDGLTKSELARLSGVSRTTVNQRLEPLLTAGLLVPAGAEARTGGRPADRFVVNPSRAAVLLADMGATGLRAAMCDMNGAVLAERLEPSDITAGPVPVLTRIADLFARLLDDTDTTATNVCGIGVDVPGPVDHATGRVISPPIMTGWHDFDIPEFFRPTFQCPVVVEKDVNAMASGEHRLAHPDASDLVYVKFGTGVGTGIITGRQIYRGADGAAGDVGHIQITLEGEGPPPVCRCGRTGCVEAYAGGWALRRDLRELGHDVSTMSEVLQLTRDGHPDAIRLFMRATNVLGTAISDLVNLLNPRIVVLGGQFAAVDDFLFAGVREVVYRRSLPLATRRLEIVPSTLADHAGVHGLAGLVLDEVYSPAQIARLLGTTAG